jgi:hypothetical protein
MSARSSAPLRPRETIDAGAGVQTVVGTTLCTPAHAGSVVAGSAVAGSVDGGLALPLAGGLALPLAGGLALPLAGGLALPLAG